MTEPLSNDIARDMGRGCGWGFGLILGAGMALVLLYLIVRLIP